MMTHTPTPRLIHYTVGQKVILKGASASRDALLISAIQDDGYYKLVRGSVSVIAAASHEVML